MIQLKKTLLTLVALLAVTTGAWADETETLLTTITATGQSTYSETTPGVVTVTHDNDYFSDDRGWLWRSQPGSLIVEAKKGYTITKCVFNQPEKTPVTVSTAPFNVNFIYNEGNDKYICVGTDPNKGIEGFKSIEVYGYASPAGTAVTFTRGTGDKANEWTMDGGMPAGNVLVSVEYWPYAELATNGLTAATDAAAKTDALLVTEADNAATGGTLKYAIGTDATTAPTTGWGTVIPTAENCDAAGGQAFVWYYIEGDDEHSDTEPQCLTVTVLPEPTYNVTMADPTDAEAKNWTIASGTSSVTGDNEDGLTGVKKGDKVTVKYSGDRKVIGVKAEKKAAAVAVGHALAVSAVGELVGSDGLAYAVADKDKLPDGVQAAGMVAYKNGSNGLVIALRDLWDSELDVAKSMKIADATGADGVASHTPAVSGYSWALITADNWKLMMTGNDTDGWSQTALATALAAVGGEDIDNYSDHWTSTMLGSYPVYFFNDEGVIGFYPNDTGSGFFAYIRPCFAF